MSNDLIMECQNQVVCLGGDENNMFGHCEEGYTGILCGSCEHHYTALNWRTCLQCPSSGTIIFNSILLFFKVTFIVFLIWWLNVEYAETNILRYKSFI